MSSLLLRRCRPAYSTPVIFATLWLYTTTTRPSNSSPRLCTGHFTQLTFTVELVFKLLPYLQPGSSSCLSTHRSILCLLLSLQNVVISVHLESSQRGSPSPSLQWFLSRGPRQFAISLTKRGLKRLLGTASRQKHPITPAILLRLRQQLTLDLPSHAAIWALFCTAFFSFLRKSNLTVASCGLFDPSCHLSRRDIKFTTSGAVLRIRWTKTLQHKQGLLLLPIPSIPGSSLCPVTALLHFLTIVPAPSTAPLFCLPAASGVRPLTFSIFSASLKHLISAIGLDPRHFSPHSFRRGGATFAYQSGVPEHLIKLHGDWRSDAFRAYLTLPLDTRSQVADIMAAGLYSNDD